MQMANREIWDARSLAHAMAIEPEAGVQALRSGVAIQWLRRGLGDAMLAARLEELARHRVLDSLPDDTNGDATLAMRAIAVIDPLAPLCWRGLVLWPDGIGTAFAAAQATDPGTSGRLQELVALELAGNWAAVRPERCDFAVVRSEARQQHGWLKLRGTGGGEERLCYLLNPLMPCASKLMSGRWVTRLPDLLLALEEAAARADHKQARPVDGHIAAFIAARSERRLDSDLAALTGPSGDAASLAQMRILAQIQARYRVPALPRLAGWLAEQAEPVLAAWRNRANRAAIAERLQILAKAGFLPPSWRCWTTRSSAMPMRATRSGPQQRLSASMRSWRTSPLGQRRAPV
jgi:hypothetical protein